MNRTQDTGRTVTAAVLIGLGVLFLLAQTFSFSFIGVLWPLFVILPGAAFLYFALTGGKDKAGLIFPGSIISGTGLILMYQNLTGHWESWAYAWLLYPILVGLSIQFVGERTGDQNAVGSGRGMVRYGGLAFLFAALLFELVFFGKGGFLGGLALPLVLIGLGALMLLRPGAPKRKSKNDDDSAFVGARLVGLGSNNHNGAPAINADLQRRIDAALAEDDSGDRPENN